MALPSLMRVLGDRRALRRWREASEAPVSGDLAGLLPAAKRLRAEADALARAGERQLSVRADAIELPPQADWAWRPDPWAVSVPPGVWAGVAGGDELAPGVKLFHDCPLSEIALRQARAPDAQAGAPWMLAMDVLGFEGSFLSLALDLPDAGREGLGPAHIVTLKGEIALERQQEVFARLNVRHGPNTETLVQELRPGDRPDGRVEAEFDLGLQEINARKVTHAWLDLIFDKPAMTVVSIRDITLTRRPRADL